MSVNLPSVGSPFVVLSDLDGVVWLAHQPIPGSVEAIARLRAAGHRVLFVTNKSAALVQEQESRSPAQDALAAGHGHAHTHRGGHGGSGRRREQQAGRRTAHSPTRMPSTVIGRQLLVASSQRFASQQVTIVRGCELDSLSCS